MDVVPKQFQSIPSEVVMSGSLIGLLLLICVLAIVAKDVNTNRKKTYGDLDIVPCEKFPPCPKGYYCVEGSFSCFYDDTCEVIPTECQPLSCPDILGCDGLLCYAPSPVVSNNGGDDSFKMSSYGDLDVIPCKDFPKCQKGYRCVEGSSSCRYDDFCFIQPTECQPLVCPDPLGCDSEICPKNMHKKKCFSPCEKDCQGEFDDSTLWYAYGQQVSPDLLL
ncbi:unnamed protein product [Nippostrongylus brasiliensis]|uniref:TIL domain-containing protein n=1 Tax=Nippostrongylus brasiliensis TaxID=27835 RepID=A0A0N4YTS6_NIPBR|nr:unnamed protein product [Nippostrongylus brasiliensis]